MIIMNNKNKSFTLIELLVVIVIIGILAGVIMISTSSSIDKANFAKAQAFSSTVQNELLSNLVSEWTFDNPSNLGEDAWGNNNGTIVGAPTPKDKNECVFGKCLSFNGMGDYVDCGNILNLKQSFTISLWSKRISSTGSYGTLLSIDPGSWSGPTGGFLIFDNNSGGITARGRSHADTTEFGVNFETAVPNNEWRFYVLIWEKPYALAYRNGIKIDSRKWDHNIGWNTLAMFIAKGFDFFSGSLDDIRIYNASLSSSQIKQNYIAGLNSMLANGNISKQEYNERINALAYDK
jgi:prepilin-type N-terminal cleavage/methylation domain-containing protein